LRVVNQFYSGVLNALLDVILILEYGFVGAAMATVSMLAGFNLLRVGQVWYLEGLQPYDLTYAKPLTAGGVSIFTMFAIGTILSGYVLLVSGAALGFASVAVMRYLLGFEESKNDKKAHRHSRLTNPPLGRYTPRWSSQR
jgi:O-antigen/teichoic acid export membrane protein